MQLIDAINTRRSCRKYAAEKVHTAAVESLLEAAANAPSACNRRGWRSVLVQDRASLDWLFRSGGSTVLKDAQQALIVCYEADTENREWNDNIQSAAAFIAYFQLLAHDLGIGSCWICHLPPKVEVNNYFSIPGDFIPVAVITFGYYLPGNVTVQRETSGEKIVCYEKWTFSAQPNHLAAKVSLTRKILRRIYYFLPLRSLLRPLADRYEKRFDE